MKAWKISCIVLAATVLLCLVSSLGIGRQCRLWQAQLREADALAAQDDCTGAAKKLSALYRDWQGAQRYLNFAVHRDELAAVESCFRRASALLSSQDTVSGRDALAELSARLEFLAENQRIHPRNIF